MTAMIKRRARRSHEQWQQLLDEQRRGALGEAAFCERNGIGLERFRIWKRQLAVASAPMTQMDEWLALEPMPAPAAAAAGWDVELDLGQGLCLRLRRSAC